MTKLGTLYLVPNTLGDDARVEQLPWVLPSETIAQSAKLKYWIVEDTKTARALLKSIDSVSPLACSIQEITAMLMACLNSLAPQSLLCLGVDLSMK